MCGRCAADESIQPQSAAEATEDAASAQTDDDDDASASSSSDNEDINSACVAATPDRFRQIFFSEMAESEYAKKLDHVKAAKLEARPEVEQMAVHSTVYTDPVVVGTPSDQHIRQSIWQQYLARHSPKTALNSLEARVYSYMREYCDIFFSARLGQ